MRRRQSIDTLLDARAWCAIKGHAMAELEAVFSVLLQSGIPPLEKEMLRGRQAEHWFLADNARA